MFKRLILMACFTTLLAACADENAWSPPAQAWQDMTIRVESRPVIPQAGSNEFLIIASRQQRGFVNDLLVHVRSNNSDWKQAIPDGALGVFRRSVVIQEPTQDRLHVRLKRGDVESELVFELTKASP
jgi:hypothetical protein